MGLILEGLLDLAVECVLVLVSSQPRWDPQTAVCRWPHGGTSSPSRKQSPCSRRSRGAVSEPQVCSLSAESTPLPTAQAWVLPWGTLRPPPPTAGDSAPAPPGCVRDACALLLLQTCPGAWPRGSTPRSRPARSCSRCSSRSVTRTAPTAR